MNLNLTLGDIIEVLPDITSQHARTSRAYGLLEKVAGQAIKVSRFALTQGAREILGGLGEVELPYYKMGAIDSLDLFGLDELIIFAFYWASRIRYERAADIGANIGLHSILMSRCGWSVKAYEPDPAHASVLDSNLRLNQINSVEVVRAAVSDREGQMEFVRVLGNTTSSHLAGAKANPYGEIERFPVKVVPIDQIMAESDFIKMDAEGQEKIIVLATNVEQWVRTDMILEVGTEENARAIHAHLEKLGVNAFAQKSGWGRVQSLADMPTSYKQGSLFVSAKSQMVW